jgi:hypothetical protein
MYVRGHQCNIIGRIDSGESAIELKSAGVVKLRDEVDVIGGSAPNAAQIADSIRLALSIVTGSINARVERVYITNDEHRTKLLVGNLANYGSVRCPNNYDLCLFEN